MKTHPTSVKFVHKVTDPPLTRAKGMFTHPGSILLGIIAAAYTAMLFGIIPQDTADKIFGALEGERNFVVSHASFAIELLVIVMAAFVLYAFTMPFIGYAMRNRGK